MKSMDKLRQLEPVGQSETVTKRHWEPYYDAIRGQSYLYARVAKGTRFNFLLRPGDDRDEIRLSEACHRGDYIQIQIRNEKHPSNQTHNYVALLLAQGVIEPVSRDEFNEQPNWSDVLISRIVADEEKAAKNADTLLALNERMAKLETMMQFISKTLQEHTA